MNQYRCFYKGRTVDVEASTQLQARDKAAVHFKAKKAYMVTAMLCQRANGTEVIHTAVD